MKKTISTLLTVALLNSVCAMEQTTQTTTLSPFETIQKLYQEQQSAPEKDKREKGIDISNKLFPLIRGVGYENSLTYSQAVEALQMAHKLGGDKRILIRTLINHAEGVKSQITNQTTFADIVSRYQHRELLPILSHGEMRRTLAEEIQKGLPILVLNKALNYEQTEKAIEIARGIGAPNAVTSCLDTYLREIKLGITGDSATIVGMTLDSEDLKRLEATNLKTILLRNVVIDKNTNDIHFPHSLEEIIIGNLENDYIVFGQEHMNLISSLPKLEKLTIKSNWTSGNTDKNDYETHVIRSSSFTFFRTLTNLETLVLKRPYVKHYFNISTSSDRSLYITPDFLSYLPNSLKNLEWENIYAEDGDLPELGHLSNLKRLSLPETELSDSGVSRLSGLTNLEILDLCGMDISDKSLPYFSNFTKLQCLLLPGTKISDKIFSSLAHLNDLKVLDLKDTMITFGGILTMIQSPNCMENLGTIEIMLREQIFPPKKTKFNDFLTENDGRGWMIYDGEIFVHKALNTSEKEQFVQQRDEFKPNLKIIEHPRSRFLEPLTL